jgi:hypothetical protein
MSSPELFTRALVVGTGAQGVTETMPADQGPERWRVLAAEALALAKQLTDPTAREAMLVITEKYIELAERAERRRKEDRSE